MTMRNFAAKSITVEKPNVDVIASLMELRGIRDIDPEQAADRFVRYTASAEKCDSMGDVVMANGWKFDDWNTNPAMFLDHQHEVLKMVARGLQAYVKGSDMIVDCFYLFGDTDPTGVADAVYKMVRKGIVTDCSIGAIPLKYHWASDDERKKYGEDTWRIWESQMLKEVSAVGIGALSSAKVDTVAKSLKDGTLTPDDCKALTASGDEYLAGLIERGLWRVNGAKTISAPVPTSVPDHDAAFAEVLKRLDDATKAAESAGKTLQRGAEMSRKAAQGLVIPLTVEQAEQILTFANGIAEVLTDIMPKPDDKPENTESPADPFENSSKSADGVSLNRVGAKNARTLVNAGKVDESSDWEFTAEDGNALLGSDGDDWENYAKWFLGTHTDAEAKTKERYAYPFGKGGKVYRSGVIAAKSRAAQQGHDAIASAADALLKLIDNEDDEKSLMAEIQRRSVAARF